MSAQALTYEEAVDLGALDGVLYSHYWFPNIVGMDSPPFHYILWDLYEKHRFASAKIFRGGAKTTIARLFASKRIAYGLSHTILFIGPNQAHAAESVKWIMRQVEYNLEWAQAFGLKKGRNWTPTNCEIIHEKFDYPIRIMALGITGAVRGINIDGFRPDLIVVDDPCDEENTATIDQRTKIEELFFAALKESLVPVSQDPTACMILAQTPFDEEDLCHLCEKSPEFATLTVGILDDYGNPAWPQRWDKEQIEADKQAAIALNQLSLWMREKMCLIVAKELSSFREEWLEYWEVLPLSARYVMAIDPAPILSEKTRATGRKTDLQAVMVKCYWRGHGYIVEYATARDEDPDQLAANVNRLSRKYPVIRCGVEGVAYQRTLKWFLERQMQAGRIKALHMVELPAVGDKIGRIIQAHAGPASNGMLHVHRSHTEFIEQFIKCPNIRFKDLLDVSAMCDATISPRIAGLIPPDSFAEVDETDIPALEWKRPV